MFRNSETGVVEWIQGEQCLSLANTFYRPIQFQGFSFTKECPGGVVEDVVSNTVRSWRGFCSLANKLYRPV